VKGEFVGGCDIIREMFQSGELKGLCDEQGLLARVTRLLEPPEGRQVFRLTFEPTAADIDENGHVNNVVYLRWAQDMGIAHWRSLAPPDAQATWAWIALRHEIDYRRELKLGEAAQAAPGSPRPPRAPATTASSVSTIPTAACAPRSTPPGF
jgi:hypothetical protein